MLGDDVETREACVVSGLEHQLAVRVPDPHRVQRGPCEAPVERIVVAGEGALVAVQLAVHDEQVAGAQQAAQLSRLGDRVERAERIPEQQHEASRRLGIGRQRGEVVGAREVRLDPVRHEVRCERAAARQLEQRLAGVDREVGDAHAVRAQRLQQQQILVTLARAEAHHLERARGEVPRESVGRPRDERAGAHVVAVRAVGAEGEPGPHGQRKPVKELLGQAPVPERGNEFLGEIVLCEQGLSRDHRPQSYRLTGSTATRRIDQTAVFLVVQLPGGSDADHRDHGPRPQLSSSRDRRDERAPADLPLLRERFDAPGGPD